MIVGRSTPGWMPLALGVFESTPVMFGSQDLWKMTWTPLDERVTVWPRAEDKSYELSAYSTVMKGRTVTFAAGEVSNGVWVFYRPDRVSDRYCDLAEFGG
ncbi:hypothetical protein [Maricaulis sp.]|uniref:hypothetical protein n=1 Tax=Maricaulis sp. TaxID=1486257 RepID=UPI003A9067AA